MRCLDKAPDNVVRMTRKAMGKAAKNTVGSFKGRMPHSWGDMAGYKLYSMASGNINVLIGLFNVGETKKTMSWFHAYWQNYGTLQGRDPRHRFDNPVKSRNKMVKHVAVRRRTSEQGIRYDNFFETATLGVEEMFYRNFQEALLGNNRMIYDR